MAKGVNHNPFDLSGKCAVVTGGAGIIGAAVCRGLAAHGASVAVVDIDGAGAEAVAAGIDAADGAKAVGIACDVSDPQSVRKMVETAVTALGGIDVLHNNAATKTDNPEAFFAPVEDYSLKTWRAVMAVNLDGMFLVAQAVGKQMMDQGRGGSLIQTSSIYGIAGPDPRLYGDPEPEGVAINTPPAYAASKAAVVGLSRYLATYWAARRIRVNTLVPGGVASGQSEAFKEQYAARTPLGRMADRTEMVGAVVYLASDASSYVTGQTFVVDGGWTAW